MQQQIKYEGSVIDKVVMQPKYSSRDTTPTKPSFQKMIPAKRTVSSFVIQSNSQKAEDFKVSPRNNQRS